MLTRLCPPALLYVGFSVAQILIDTVKGLYNTAMFKFIVMIIFTILLNTLCRQGLGIISWFIVFVPFLMMTFLTSILLFVFDLSPDSGSMKYNVETPDKKGDKSLHHDASRHEPHNQMAPPPPPANNPHPPTSKSA